MNFKAWLLAEAMQTLPPPGTAVRVRNLPAKTVIEYVGGDGARQGGITFYTNKHGHCQISSVDAPRGYGPLLFYLAAEVATKRGSMLVPDKNNSTDFQQVWKRFQGAPGVELVPLGRQAVARLAGTPGFEYLGFGVRKQAQLINTLPITFA